MVFSLGENRMTGLAGKMSSRSLNYYNYYNYYNSLQFSFHQKPTGRENYMNEASCYSGLRGFIKCRHDGFAPDLGHDGHHGVAEVLLLLLLRPNEHVVPRETLDELQLVDAQHPHGDVHDAKDEHELFDFL